MPKIPAELSPTEWSLMKICWSLGKSTGREIFDITLREKRREYQTVKTMLDRLVQKGYLNREKKELIYIYRPIVTRANATRRAVKRFAATVLDNTLTPLLLHCAKGESLNDNEIASLKKLIEKEERKNGKR